MEPYFVLAQKNVLFHGIWKPRSRVSESLIQSIGATISSTPSRPCKLLLTSTGLTLFLLPSGDGKKGKTDQIPFHSLADIFINKYNTECLLIIYIDGTKKPNVLAFTSQDSKDLHTIFTTYNIKKNRIKPLLDNHSTKSGSQSHPNWVIRQNSKQPSDQNFKNNNQSSSKPRISSGFALVPGTLTEGAMLSAGQYESSQRSDLSDSYRHFSGGSDLDVNVMNDPRAAVVGDGSAQTQKTTQDSESDESSVGSFYLKSLKDDEPLLTKHMATIKINNEDKTKSAGESGVKRLRIEILGNYMTSSDSDSKDETDNVFDDRSPIINIPIDSGSTKRYTKKHANITTINATKEKVAALRTRSSSTGSRSASTSGPNSVGDDGAETSSSSLGGSGRSSSSSSSHQQQNVKSAPPPGLSRPGNKPVSPGGQVTTAAKPKETAASQGKLGRKQTGR